MWKFMHFVFQKVLHVRVIIINQLVLHSSCVNLMFLRICYHVVCAFFPTVYSFINNISCTNWYKFNKNIVEPYTLSQKYCNKINWN